MESQFTSKVMARLHEVTASGRGTRYDLRLTDMVEIEPNSVFKLVIGFEGNKAPTLPEVVQFVRHATQNTVTPVAASARVHFGKRHNGVSMVVEANKVRRPVADAKRMIPVVANTTFIDTDLGDQWNVKFNEQTGKKFLECARAENVTALLTAEVSASIKACGGLTLGDETIAGACCAEKGDVVAFYAENAQRQGTVTSVKGEDVRIAESDGNTFIVPMTSVIDIIKKNEAAAQEDVNEQAAFYAKFYGVDFARKMFPNARI